MNNLLPQFERFKEKIPQFIIKLYHILEQSEYSDYLAWNGDELVIKNVKKLEEKVLPNFFRHKHLSSFIRQLNMYKFSKVSKLTKEKGCIYFKNEHFKRGQIKQLTQINRNNKKTKTSNLSEEGDSESRAKSDNISINNELEANNSLLAYKKQVKNTVTELMKILKGLQSSHPEAKGQLTQPLTKCNELLEIPSEGSNFSFLNLDQSLQNKNMMSTMKLLPIIEPVLFASQCSFFQIN